MNEIQYVNEQMKHFDRLIGDIDCISASTEGEILGAIRLELISAYRAGREEMLNAGQKVQILIALADRVGELKEMIDSYKGLTDQESANAVAYLRKSLNDAESAERLIADC